jgi:hypothetical protein
VETRPGYLRSIGAEPPRAEARPAPDPGNIALIASLFLVNIVPVAGEVIRPGSWGAGTVGLATACALVAGRELWHELRALVRARG